MSVKDLFKKTSIDAPFSIESVSDFRKLDLESTSLIEEKSKLDNKYVPMIDFSLPQNFSKYGSAREYYSSSFERILSQYPYDGSETEVTQFYNNSSYLDLYLLEKRYPKTNGYVVFSSDSWGTPSSITNGWGAPSETTKREYIYFTGGPNTASLSGTSIKQVFSASNVYQNLYKDTNFSSQRSGLEFDISGNGYSGVTIEFWLKKDAFNTSNTHKESVLDVWNNELSSSDSYGRITLSLSASATTDAGCMQLAVTSGSTTNTFNFTNTTSASIGDGLWHHYAALISKTEGVHLYVDGNKKQSFEAASLTIGNTITGSMRAAIGGLVTTPSGNVYHGLSMTGYGKLSASLDDFRYWTIARTPKQIHDHFGNSIYGGANTSDKSLDNMLDNIHLGVAYRFNEGITATTATDSIVLDYSGRINNGKWINYPGSSARNTGSAMYESGLFNAERQDPIIRRNHPSVVSVMNEMHLSGSEFDINNHTAITKMLPGWILDEEENSKTQELIKLTQIMGSYFDTLYLQTEAVNKIQAATYVSSSNVKPNTLADKLLISDGLVVPDLFVDADLMNSISDRSSMFSFENKLQDVKNMIYQNIYNNLNYIYKSKGTEKAYRNMLRCFGVDDEEIRINLYAQNEKYNLENNYSFASKPKKVIDFYNPNNFSATIYQTSSNSNSKSYISSSLRAGPTSAVILATYDERFSPFTIEGNIVFPKPIDYTSDAYFENLNGSSSLFGFHHLDRTNPDDYTTPASDIHLHTYCVHSSSANSTDGRAYFVLSGNVESHGSVFLTSSFFNSVFDNSLWNISVRIKPETYPYSYVASGSSIPDYDIEFTGYQSIGDSVVNSFYLTQSVGFEKGAHLILAQKRVYAGANRQNFTGSVITQTDCRVASIRAWNDYVSDDQLKEHSKNPFLRGVDKASRNAYLEDDYSVSLTPKAETILLNWEFDEVTSTDSNGTFTVKDMSSGSNDIGGRYHPFGSVFKYEYPAVGKNFKANFDVAKKEYLSIAKHKLPEVVNSHDLVNIASSDDMLFTRESRPINHHLSFEKSMYASISDEMINMFGGVVDFNKTVGNPVNRYRGEYKDLSQLRTLFFERVGNTPDLNKYVEYYSWLDSSLSALLQQLVPSSVSSNDKVLNVIENHVLERNLYRTKYPILTDENYRREQDNKFEGKLYGLAEMLYPWSIGYHPVSNSETENCFWWKERSLRTDSPPTSGDSAVDSQRDVFKTQIVSYTSGSVIELAKPDNITTYKRSEYASRKFSKIYDLKIEIQNDISNIGSRTIKSGYNHSKAGTIASIWKQIIGFGSSAVAKITLENRRNCASLNNSLAATQTPSDLRKTYYKMSLKNSLSEDSFTLGTSVPFTLVSTTAIGGYQDFIDSNFGSDTKIDLAGLHIDSANEDFEVTLQSPWTEKSVGGAKYRHASLNVYDSAKSTTNKLDDITTRAEGWTLTLSANNIDIGFPSVNNPRATLSRGTKSVIGVSNSRIATSSNDTTETGNYQEKYEVVMTSGRSNNNNTLYQSDISLDLVSSGDITGVVEFAKINRKTTKANIVNRFSSPGGPETGGDNQGGPGLDTYSAEFSPYNAMPWRNLTVRLPLNTLSTRRSEQFGIASGSTVSSLDYNTNASFHSVNKNRTYTLKDIAGVVTTASLYDNLWIQGSIPKNTTQYSWINSAYTSSYVFGHPYSELFSSSIGYEPVLGFTSQSVQSYGGNYIDYNKLNTLVYEPITASLGVSEMMFGYPLSSDIASYKNTSIATLTTGDVLNGILLNRYGPYSHNIWKQIRTAEHPVVSYLKKNNIIAVNEFATKTLNIEQKLNELVKNVRYGKLQTFKEPAVVYNKSDRFVGNTGKSFRFGMTNSTERFSNSLLNKMFDTLSLSEGQIEKIKEQLSKNDIESYVKSVVLFPSKINTGRFEVRNRINYSNNFWRDSRENRNTLGVTKSSWALDADYGFTTNTVLTSSNFAGSLQNNKTLVHSNIKSNITASAVFARKHTLGAKYSFASLFGKNVYGASSLLHMPQAAPAYFPKGNADVFGGNAEFETNRLSGYVNEDGTFVSASRNPFADSYSDFAEQMRGETHNFSVVPEFRISDFADYYLTNRGDFFTNNTASLKIVGSSGSDSSTSDFYKLYATTGMIGAERVLDKSLFAPKSIKLKTKVIKKFVPYNGFYPAERTLELTTQFSRSYSNGFYFEGTDSTYENAKARPIYDAMFSPGLLYNTIKSGIAVDYPVLTGSKSVINILSGSFTGSATGYWLLGTGSGGTAGWDKRIPFEALLSPSRFLKDLKLIDMEPHPSASLDLTASWDGTGNALYSLAANNFFAETINFFLKDEELTTLVSKPQSDFGEFLPNKTYGMRVIMRRSMNQKRVFATAYPRPENSISQSVDNIYGPNLKENFTLYSRASAFGPPVAARQYIPLTGSTAVFRNPNVPVRFIAGDSLDGYNPSFTPPYYDGEAWADIIFKTDSEKRTYTVADIFSGSTVIYWRFDPDLWSDGVDYDLSTTTPYYRTNINNFAMQLSASVNLFKTIAVDSKEFASDGTVKTIKEDFVSNNKAWAIQTKFETPMLNFADSGSIRNISYESGSLTLPIHASESVANGIWHQFGLPPDSTNKGVFLEVQEIDSDWLANKVGSLSADLQTTYNNGTVRRLDTKVGFAKSTARLGELANSKEVFEAVINIPFYESKNKKKFFAADKKAINNISKAIDNKQPVDMFDPMLVSMVSAMKKYILPPQFDFLKNKKIKPFLFNVTEFKHIFDKDDLSFMWQNIAPKLGTEHQFEENETEFPLNQEMINNLDNIQWLVFKVKQKAEWFYSNKTISDPDNHKLKGNSDGIKNVSLLDSIDYSYNWPYDFFSFVESANIVAEVEYKNEKV